MFFYLLFVLFAYYILKPASRAMFLNKLEVDKLPWLYILIAVFACRAAGTLGNRPRFHTMVNLLPSPHVRWAAASALAAYGPRITGSLGDMLDDQGVDARIRRQIPRVLKQIPDQRAWRCC